MAKFFLILVTVLCVLGASKAFDKKEAVTTLLNAAEECKTQVKATDSDLEDMAARKPASTKEGKCLRACLMKKFQVMDSNGKFVPEVAEKHASEMTDGTSDRMKIAREIINACAKIDVSSDHCEAAEQYGKCFKEQADAHGIKDDYKF
ncbi:general odorant-binding protein 28a-like [Haematobia irritans]|uniref:general odorant-binding protein 28a-like n=1 Tax=Haematobia irritans TaxID=7368 RepID=UPI003F5035A8